MKKIVALIASTLLLGTFSAQAQETGPYMAGALGQSKYDIDGLSGDNKDTSGMLTFGYQLNKNVGFELGYSEYGKLQFSGLTGKANSGHISAILSAPVADAFSIYARLGAASTRRDISGRFSGTVGERKTEAILGLGSSYAINKNLTATLEWHSLNNSDVSALNLGLRVYF